MNIMQHREMVEERELRVTQIKGIRLQKTKVALFLTIGLWKSKLKNNVLRRKV